MSGIRSTRTRLFGLVTIAIAAITITACGNQASLQDEVTRVEDGDTLVLADGTRLHLLGVNAPEPGSPCADEATLFVTEFVKDPITVQSHRRAVGGAVVGTVRNEDGVGLSRALVEARLAAPDFTGFEAYERHALLDSWRFAGFTVNC